MSSVFSRKDYNSPDGMMSGTWGPSTWHYLHTVSFNYPTTPTQEDRKLYTNMLMNIGATLPCSYCRNNFKTNMKKAKFSQKDMISRDSFSRFIYRLHNHVNKMLGKNIKISFEEVRDRYEHFRSRCIPENSLVSKKKEKEKGCTDSLYGKKSKCVICIVPQTSKKKSFSMDPKCKLKRKKD